MVSQTTSLPYLVRVAILLAVYFATARLGLLMDAVSGFAAAVWPPTGISLAALSLFGYGLWPGIALGAFLVNLSAGAPLPAACGMAVGNTLEAILGAYLLRRVVGFHPSLARLRDVLGLVVFAAVCSTLVSATLGVTSGWLGGVIPAPQWAKAWWTWWVGDMMGDLVVAPLLFVWGSSATRTRLSPGRRAEAGALLVALCVVCLLVFGARFPARVTNAAYIPFPFLIWAALRFGQRGAVTATFAASVIAIWGTAQGRGPFAMGSLNESLLALQTFTGVAAVTILVLAADVGERRRAEEALREARDALEKRVQERTAELARANAGLASEIGERARVEDSLRKSESLLAEAQQIAHLGSWEWDILRNVVTWTEELYRIYGIKPGEVALNYETFLAHVHPDDREFVKATVERSNQGRQPFAYDHRIVRPDGTVRWVHGQGAVVVDESGEPVRMLGTGQDITERKGVEEALRRAHDDLEIRVQERTAELEQANHAKDRFLAMLAHELRNPLASIRNAVQLLKLLAPSDPRMDRAREIIERQVVHQAHLLDDLLNVTRIAQGKIELRRKPLDLARLVRDTVEDYRSLLEAAGLSLTLDLPEAAVWVEGDPTRLAQIAGNLLQNAAKFTDRGGQVTVRLTAEGQGSRVKGQGSRVKGQGSRVDGDPFDPRPSTLDPHPSTLDPRPSTLHRAVLTVRDTGIGIEPGLLSRLFEPFTQADRSLDRSRGGLGLGLALVKGLVDLHQGEVRAASDGLGRGAAFTVLLPILADERRTTNDQSGMTNDPQGMSNDQCPMTNEPASPIGHLSLDIGHSPPRCRVLLVEDNPDAAETLRDVLLLSHCTVEVAASGPEALAIAARFRPEVVLCDLGLPGMDGYQVAAELRQNPTTAGAHLIAVSGYGQEEDQRRSREAGFDLHLTKPIDPAELLRLLEVAH